MPSFEQPLSWLTCPQAPQSVVVGVSTCQGGCSAGVYAANNMALHVGDEPETVERNRAALQAGLGASDIQWLEQVHGIRCIQANRATLAQAPQADAAWTQEAGLALAIMTADCVPVLLWDDSGAIVGAAHAGWRGLTEGVLESAVNAMLEQLPRARLSAWIGPCISAPHYEVGEEVWRHFAGLRTKQGIAVVKSHPLDAAMASGKRLLDLAGAAELRLLQLGVGEVFQSGLCSFADDRFYSHRQAQQQAPGQSSGRMASVIMRLPGQKS